MYNALSDWSSVDKLESVSFSAGGGPGERSSSGLLEWESINDAMEALAMMNHYQMKNPSKYANGLETASFQQCGL